MVPQGADGPRQRTAKSSKVGRAFDLASDQQIFTREELRERRSLLTKQRAEKLANKNKTKAEQAAELKARMILCVAIIVACGGILWWLDGRPSF